MISKSQFTHSNIKTNRTGPLKCISRPNIKTNEPNDVSLMMAAAFLTICEYTTAEVILVCLMNLSFLLAHLCSTAFPVLPQIALH